MDKEELKDILAKHKMWLYRKPGGVKANLSGAYLRGATIFDGWTLTKELK